MEDWGQVFSFEPARVLRPTSVDELSAILERTHRAGGRLRVPGSLHSCAEIVVADTLLDTSGLPHELAFDTGDGAVDVTANTTLHEFLAALSERDRSVTATGGTDHQTLAGLISTGTAPASSRHALYELLDHIDLVTLDSGGSAVQRRIARGSPDWPAAVCSLGLLGVLVGARFRLVEEKHFTVEQRVIRLDDVLADLDATAATYDFWRVNWLQKSDKALLWAATEIPASQSNPAGDYPEDRSEHILDIVFAALDKVLATGPLLTRPLELIYDALAIAYTPSTVRGPLRTMLPVDRRAPLRVAMAEWSFRPGDVHRVLGESEQYFDGHGWPNIPTEIELTRCDGALMSPWNWPGEDYVVKFNWMYLTEVCTEPGEKDLIHAHLRGLWEHLRAAGVPFKAHWGKLNFMDPAFVAEHHDFEAFRPLVCPLFANRYLTERLGPL